MSYFLIGIGGTQLSKREREWLGRPEVGGLTLFARNIEADLITEIRAVDPDALICIDQEGGRVQRIKTPCTTLPPLKAIGDLFQNDDDDGITLAYHHAWLMAAEMRALGIDLSFAPVLDLDCGSSVIGDRSFSADPLTIKALARAYLKGMQSASMPATGKHFPGHGSILADTHVDSASDTRPFDELAINDLRPFTVAIGQGLDAVMMAHVVYPQVCSQAAGYSKIWIQDVLRQRIGFQGIVFSDDLGMRAAECAGGYQQRLDLSLSAGCDFVLVCNSDDVAAAFRQISQWPEPSEDDPRTKLRRAPPPRPAWELFAKSPERAAAQEMLRLLM